MVGTPFRLRYQSDRTLGRREAYRVRIPLTADTFPTNLKMIELKVSIAGQTLTERFDCPCTANQGYDFEWDGRGAMGRAVYGAQIATIEVGYGYEAVYMQPSATGLISTGGGSGGGSSGGGTSVVQSFGMPSSVPMTANRARQEVTLWRRWEKSLGSWRNEGDALGGWSLSAHHAYDPNASILYLGDGSRRTGRTMSSNLELVAGRVRPTAASRADGVSVRDAFVGTYGLALGADGSIYFSDIYTDRVRKITPSGVLQTVAGVDGFSGYNGDDRAATNAWLNDPTQLAFGPDGSLYIYDSANLRIRRVTPNGMITTVAGNGTSAPINMTTFVDGIPATSSPLGIGVSQIAAAQDGSFYFSSYLSSTTSGYVRRVNPSGVITTVVGSGLYGSAGDGGPATQARLTYVAGLAVGPDSSLYISDAHANRIRRVDTNGIITTIAGTSLRQDEMGDGGPAVAAGVGNPRMLAFGPDGSLYVYAIGTELGASAILIRRIDPSGIITTFTGIRGNGPCAYSPCGLDGPPIAAWIGTVLAMTLTPTGDLLTAHPNSGPFDGSGMIVRTKATLPGLTANDIAVASEDGTEVYAFDARGRHLLTRDALLGTLLYQFGYDAAGRLTTVTDVDNQVTTIYRDGSGRPTSIEAPTHPITSLTLDPEGNLWKVTNPASETTTLTYHPGQGLLATLLDPSNRLHEFEYNADGRLTQDSDPVGFKALDREMTSSGYRVTLTTAMGRTRVHEISTLPTGGTRRTHTGSDGLATVVDESPSGVQTVSSPDGMRVTSTLRGDPRFAMQVPIVANQTIVTPLGRTQTITRTRSVSLSAPNDLLSVVSATDTTAVNGHVYTAVLDKATRTVVSTLPSGRYVTSTLTPQGRVSRVEVSGILPVELTYYPDGRLHTQSQGSRTWTSTYEDNGWLTTVTDPLLRTAVFDHDPAGRVREALRPDGEVIGASYYPGGRVQTITPPERPEHSFTYSPADLLEGYLAPDAGGIARTTTWSYDLDHLPTSSARPGEPASVYERDPASGRLSRVTLPLGMGAIDLSYHPTTGDLQSLAGPSGISLGLGYDGSLLTSRTWTGDGFGSGSGAVRWTYNNDFRVDTETVNGSSAVSFHYDADGFRDQAGGLMLYRHPQNGLPTGTSIGLVSDTGKCQRV